MRWAMIPVRPKLPEITLVVGIEVGLIDIHLYTCLAWRQGVRSSSDAFPTLEAHSPIGTSLFSVRVYPRFSFALWGAKAFNFKTVADSPVANVD